MLIALALLVLRASDGTPQDLATRAFDVRLLAHFADCQRVLLRSSPTRCTIHP